LTDKFSDVLKYLKKSLNFLETDVLEIFQRLYKKLDYNHLIDIINNTQQILFFCDSESILWKHRKLIVNFQKYEKNEEQNLEEENKDGEKMREEEININDYYKYFEEQNTDADEEIELIKKEINNMSKLNIYWEDKNIDNYKGKLFTLQNILISYKNKGIEDAEITRLRNEASSLLIKLEQKNK